MNSNNGETKFSVVVCTSNRPTCLCNVVGSLLCQTVPRSQYEVIVIDNDPSNDSKFALQPFLQQVRYFQEPERGLSYARNRGLEEAIGSYVIFIDDDALASSSWLEEIGNCFDQNPKAGVIGGRVEPIWEALPPNWLDSRFRGQLSLLNLGTQNFKVDLSKNYLVGTNVAYRKSALLKVGGFCKNLGRKGNTLLSNEEVWCNQQIESLGYDVIYCAPALVWHQIHKKRTHWYWHLRRRYWQGRSEVLLSLLKGGTIGARTEFNVLRKFLHLRFQEIAVAIVRRETSKVMGLLRDLCFQFGRWREALRSTKVPISRVGLNSKSKIGA